MYGGRTGKQWLLGRTGEPSREAYVIHTFRMKGILRDSVMRDSQSEYLLLVLRSIRMYPQVLISSLLLLLPGK